MSAFLSEPPQLSELLLQWEELQEQGQSITPEELCRDAPALLEPLKREIELLGRLEQVLTTPRPEQTVGPATVDDRHPSPRMPVIPGYTILGVIGRGGMGVVYRARDAALGREVALKMLRSGELADPVVLQRFRTEARAMAQLDHPHIVPVYAHGEHDGVSFYTMKLMRGGSLAKHQARLNGDVRAAVVLIEKVARAVDYLHQHKILHRDLKPLNILLDERDEPGVSDFGLAKLLDTDLELTQSGAVMGTLPYMSPEQAIGQTSRIGPASDVWALGVIFYELLGRRRPFIATERSDLVAAIIGAVPPEPKSTRAEIDDALQTIVLKCLHKSPAQRYVTAGAFADDLAHWLHGEPISARPQTWAGRCLDEMLRRPSLSVTVSVCILLLFTLNLAVHSFNPERKPNQLRQRLSHGLPIELIHTRVPEFHQWVHGPVALTEAPNGAGVEITTAELSLLELLPRPPRTGYRLRASVLHREKFNVGRVGVYVARTRYTSRYGAEDAFCTFTFDDRDAFDATQQRMTGTAELNLHRYYFPKHHSVVQLPGWKQYQVDVAKPHKTRRLEIEVAPAGMRAWWDGEELGGATWELINSRFETDSLTSSLPLFAGTPMPRFGPERGLGLFVINSSAIFRDVVVDPLP